MYIKMFLSLRKTLILTFAMLLASTLLPAGARAEEKTDDNFKITDCLQLVNLGNEKMLRVLNK